MKSAITYTILSVLNLIGFTIGVVLLPADVPIHFNAAMEADLYGSPWVLLALPAAVALISAAIWGVSLSSKPKNRSILTGLLAGLGAVLAVVGWTFFALAASDAGEGVAVAFPITLVIVLPLSLFVVFAGNYLPRVEPNRLLGIRTSDTLQSENVWVRTHRLGGVLFFAAGLLSAVVAVVFACVPVKFAFVSAIVLAASVLIAAIVSAVYAHVLYRREQAHKN